MARSRRPLKESGAQGREITSALSRTEPGTAIVPSRRRGLAFGAALVGLIDRNENPETGIATILAPSRCQSFPSGMASVGPIEGNGVSGPGQIEAGAFAVSEFCGWLRIARTTFYQLVKMEN
jgi:hypothetical protein